MTKFITDMLLLIPGLLFIAAYAVCWMSDVLSIGKNLICHRLLSIDSLFCFLGILFVNTGVFCIPHWQQLIFAAACIICLLAGFLLSGIGSLKSACEWRT